MDLLGGYINLYGTKYPPEIFLSALVVLTLLGYPLCRILGLDQKKSLFVSFSASLGFYSLFLLPSPRSFRMERTDREVYLHYTRAKGISGDFLNMLGPVVIYGLRKILSPFADGTKDLAKDISGFALQGLVSEYELRLYSPSARIPDRKILITNHVTSPLLDAMSFFALCRRGKPMVVLQHNFNKLVSLVSNWGWGGYTIDKDDKTPEGKSGTLEKISRLLELMKREKELTVVIYVQGKVPKTVSETRSPGRFYPGAVYLSMMSGYPVLPLVSDFNGVKFTSSCRQPVYLRKELTGRFVDEPDLGKFRETNRELIEEQAQRFRRVFVDEYERIKNRERFIVQTKRGVHHASRATESRGKTRGCHSAQDYDPRSPDDTLEL